MELNVLYEDSDIIVLHKPAGVPIQTKDIAQKDMVDLVSEYRRNKNEKPEIFVVHRLDQPVEGAVVMAKTKEAAASLSKQITEHDFKKKYYAIISREAFPDEGVLEDYLVKDMRTNMSKVVKSTDPRAKRAVLSYTVVDQWDDRKLLDIELFTGRHHQIRIQLASRTAPILGDVKYGGIATGRALALCSHYLGFKHPSSGEWSEFYVKPEGEDFIDSKVI
ncbi:MAG: RNA pseudouridine synthase [Pseudobutyrivibrio sp.]|nr:RNA pseudouridine synthase [Pseudobutyrivibrio sp.]